MVIDREIIIMKKYIPQEFEQKWAEKWEAEGLFQKSFAQENVSDENKKYLLFAFAYPSGSGLHVGHVESMTALDILARYYRSIGKKVFFPVGWDAFGLPAENYAIKTGIPPVKTTQDALQTFRHQMKRIGISYDWATEIATCHPGYYKWTQWLFLQLYKKGKAYKKSAPVNWCPSCQTVLANEQVVNGECERCGSKVIQKEMEQWFFKITDYKDELISGLEQVDWPSATKQQQLNWIGRSEGALVQFKITSYELQVTNLEVFTTAHDTIYGATFIVVAPEHALVKEILDKQVTLKDQTIEKIQEYVEYSRKKTEEERLINKEKTGIFSGLYATNPLTKQEIPVWIADYVLGHYGTGAIMAVPGNDERDYEFAKKFHLPIIYTAQEKNSKKEHSFISFSKEIKSNPTNYILINSGEFTGIDFKQGREKIMLKLEELKSGKRETTYNLRDWLISRQRSWGAPIPVVYDPQGKAHAVKEEHLPWLLPTDVDFKPTGESPLRGSQEFIQRVETLYGKGWRPEFDTMDTFVDSSWYYLRYTDPRNEESLAKKEHLQKWMPIDFYMIGPEHIVLHLLYSRFFTKFLRDEGYLSSDEPFSHMRHQGMILGPDNRKMSKSKGNVINPDMVIADFGADTLRMYEMFMGPIEADKPWSEGSVGGVYRFLIRIWRKMQEEYNHPVPMKSEHPSLIRRGADNTKTFLLDKEESPKGEVVSQNKDIVISLNKTIDKVTKDIESLKFNTAIAYMMSFINEWESIENKEKSLSKDDAKKLLKILSPFAPFMTEELWHSCFGEKETIHLSGWPEVDSSVLKDSQVTIPVQVNGRMRGTIVLPMDSEEEAVLNFALADEKIKGYIGTSAIKKVVFVKNKILNVIV